MSWLFSCQEATAPTLTSWKNKAEAAGVTLPLRPAWWLTGSRFAWSACGGVAPAPRARTWCRP